LAGTPRRGGDVGRQARVNNTYNGLKYVVNKQPKVGLIVHSWQRVASSGRKGQPLEEPFIMKHMRELARTDSTRKYAVQTKQNVNDR
jgi:hypothetical protein